MSQELLQNIGQRIQTAYEELGHSQGWSFLYTPGRTLDEKTRFLFMGLNPGGTGNHESVSLTTEAGNAYNPEVENDWVGNGEASPLQVQVMEFYRILSAKMGVGQKVLMDSTLAANFCPFRSRSWTELAEKQRTIEFCKNFWGELVKKVNISTIVAMSSIVGNLMDSTIIAAGGELISSSTFEVGWGNVTYSLSQYRIGSRAILMVGLPHLSRFQVFGREKSLDQTQAIIEGVARSLEGWKP